MLFGTFFLSYVFTLVLRGIPLLGLSLPHLKVYMGTITGGWQSDLNRKALWESERFAHRLVRSLLFSLLAI